jgi:membrane fusion protein, copper/silver efflux system
VKRIAVLGLILVASAAAGVGGYWAGLRGVSLPGVSAMIGEAIGPTPPVRTVTEPAASGPVIYYRDPDGAPVYSASQRQTADGRAFRAIHASEDVSFADKPAPPTGAATETVGPRKILYYRNPMGLPDTSPVPKKDSMGMDYIAVHDGDDDGGSVVTVPVGKLQHTGVRSEPAERRTVTRPVRVPGTVQLDERRIAVVATRSDAFVEEVANVTTGDRVTKGLPLVRLYSPDIAAAGAQFLTDLSVGERGGATGGARQRLANLGVPPDAVEDIERSRKVPLSLTWKAPRDGVVIERSVVDGMKVRAGDVLFRLADISMVWVLADVPEYDLGAIRLGERATIRLRGRPGPSFEGRVSRIHPQVGEATRTTKVRIEIANPDGILLPNMYADVEIATGSEDPVVAVPDSAIIDTGTRQIVIVDRGEGRFEPRAVKVGARGDGFTEIRDGITDGDRVVVAANFLIDAESNLKAALRALTAAETRP